MPKHIFAPILLTLCVSAAVAQREPALDGFVTGPGTADRFQVNGSDVVCVPLRTLTSHQQGATLHGSRDCPQHRLGEHLLVYGSINKGTVEAEDITVVTPVDVPVEGAALTDMVVSRTSKEIVVRADGFLLEITPDTKLTYDSSLTPGFAGFQTNQWIAYRGIAYPDGTVMVQKASLGPNIITDEEDKLRKQAEFDPAMVSDVDRQSLTSKFFTGMDLTRIPAYNDPGQQARVTELGNRLIPSYQRALPVGDPSKIAFRFQLVEDTRFAYYALPSGIILLSHSVAALDNDDQLAAVVATAIADVLQKQELRADAMKRKLLVADFVGDAAGLFVPGLSSATTITAQRTNQRLQHRLLEQRSRESLCLLHDADFDLHEAPVAFWQMGQKKGKTLAETPMPEHARYLYQLLGTAWASEDAPLPKLKQHALISGAPQPTALGQELR